MAFTQGVAQSIHVTTLDGVDPIAPTNPAVTVSLDGGATFEATDNAAVTTLYGISLELSAAETARDLVLVRVTADNADAQVVAFYFEDDYTAQRAANLDNADAPASQLPTNTELAAALDVLASHGDGAWATADVAGIPAAVDSALAADFSAVIDAILASSGGSGIYTATLTVVDGDGAPVGSCPVRVANAGGQLLGYGLTNSATGIAVFNLDAGEYVVTLGPLANYAPNNPHALTVAGDMTADLTVTALSAPPAPSTPDVCAVYLDTVYTHGDSAGQAVAAGDASIQYIRTVAAPAGMGVALADPDDVAQSDGSGRCTMNLLRGSIVDIMVALVGVKPRRIQITVPDQATYDLSEAL